MGRTPSGETKERIYRFVRRRIQEGLPPTVREVQEAFGFAAVQTAREHLERLVAEGRLVKHPGKARGYGLPRHRATVLVPVLGRVQAGDLTTAIQESEGFIPVQARNAQDEYFALVVRGESMRDAGILPGDVVVVRRQATAQSGDIVVALVGDEATVKRLKIRGRKVELHPANPEFQVLRPDPEELVILGKVVEVRRYLNGAPPWIEDVGV